MLLLVFVGGDAFEPGDRSDVAEEGIQFGVGGDVGLDEEGAEIWVEAGGEEVEGYLLDAPLDAFWVGVFGGEGVEVGDEEEAVVLVLELDPVVEGSHVVAEMEAPGGAHAGEDAGARIGGVGGGVGHLVFWLRVHEWWRRGPGVDLPASLLSVAQEGALARTWVSG